MITFFILLFGFSTSIIVISLFIVFNAQKRIKDINKNVENELDRISEREADNTQTDGDEVSVTYKAKKA